MSGVPILSLVTFLPLVGALVIFLFARGEAEQVAKNARNTAFVVSATTFLLSLVMLAGFDSAEAGFQLTEKAEWLPDFAIAYHMGIDGVSVWFVMLATFLTPICIMASWTAIKMRVKEYMIAFLMLETFMVGMFCALDFVAFYIFFEGVLIPMFLIIGVWGAENRIYAAFKLFLYTLAGSVLMLLAILALYIAIGTTDIPTLLASPVPAGMQFWLWLAFFASFAVKVPMWPFHTWLPDAHVQAPTAGSVILAGVLLKMGAYGFIRFSIPMLPDATEFFTPMVFALSLVALIYTSLVALAQTDMKKLIAYSSVAHMGYVTIGLFTVTEQGVTGALFQMLAHGVISSALFLCVGVIYDRMHTKAIDRYEGLANRMPGYAFFFMLFTMASVGLPGTGGFVGEFLVMLGAFEVSSWVGLLVVLGMVLGAVYMLFLYRRIAFGKLTKADLKTILDIDRREAAVFAPLAGLTIWMGVYPSTFIDPMTPTITKLIETHQAALDRAQGIDVAIIATDAARALGLL